VLDSQGEPELAVSIWHDVTPERRQEMQAEYLAKATAALGNSLVYDEMLSTLAQVLVPGLADWCSIYLYEGGRLRDVASAHADPVKQAAAEAYRKRYAPDPDHAGRAWNVVRTGQSEIHNDITYEALATSTNDPEALAMLRGLGMRAALIVPMRARDRVLGAISLVSADAARRYDAEDAALAEELGRRAGVALENAQLYAAALEASRAKDEFLATVSHELRTPLTAILGWSTLLKKRVLDPEIEKPVEAIDRNAHKQVRLIDDIMDVSSVISGKFHLDVKLADFAAIARDAIEVVRPSALAKHIGISFEATAEPCPLVADAERLQQVVWNLLSNAVKFTGDNGNIRVSLAQRGSNALLVVTDTGQGIDSELLPFVFERFKQADSSTTRRVGGLGLGLALVRHIVELHGGHVTASSEGAGKGATFTVTVPIRATLPEPLESTPPPSEVPSSRGETGLRGVRVLVVDDELDARDLIRAILGQAGAVIQTAESAAEGFIALRRFRPDVLVSDIGMPEEDGFSFMRRIRALLAAEGGKIPSLALTAFARDEDRAKAIAAGYTMHIGKPVDPAVLTSSVAELAAVARGR
jgi:signal transduction histidine kinase